jgi:hypothetical protein
MISIDRQISHSAQFPDNHRSFCYAASPNDHGIAVFQALKCCATSGKLTRGSAAEGAAPEAPAGRRLIAREGEPGTQ